MGVPPKKSNIFSQLIDGKSQELSSTSEPWFSCDKHFKICWVNMTKIETETKTEISKVSRPRLIQTKEFPSCGDRDLLRPDLDGTFQESLVKLCKSCFEIKS